MKIVAGVRTSGGDRIMKFVAGFFSTAILLGLLGWAAFKIFGLEDYMKAWDFEPTEEIAATIEALELTDKGSLIMRAAHPELETEVNFNSSCNSHDADVYVLGCYDSATDKLHLYKVRTNELPGIIESTAAHELLHAAWKRLPIWSQMSLTEKMKEFYDTLPEDAEVRNSMALYPDDEFYDELHSRLGTEIADLPEELEKHFATYFKDQDKVVAFYTSYSEDYHAREKELAELEEQISALDNEIEGDINSYTEWQESLNKKIVQFNTEVDAISLTEYYTRRAELEEEIGRYDALLDELNAKIDRYNDLVDRYNETAVHQKSLIDSINSNSGIAPDDGEHGFDFSIPDFNYSF